MNLSAYLTGSVKVLRGDANGLDYFDLSRRGFQYSFIALILTIGGYYICTVGVLQQNAEQAGQAVWLAIPLLPFALIVGIYALAFVLCAYIFSLLLDCEPIFRAWVIVRHWLVFFDIFVAAFAFALYLMGVLPFFIAQSLALICYLGVLALDISLAKAIVVKSWSLAIFIGCSIHATSLSLLLLAFLS